MTEKLKHIVFVSVVQVTVTVRVGIGTVDLAMVQNFGLLLRLGLQTGLGEGESFGPHSDLQYRLSDVEPLQYNNMQSHKSDKHTNCCVSRGSGGSRGVRWVRTNPPPAGYGG